MLTSDGKDVIDSEANNCLLGGMEKIAEIRTIVQYLQIGICIRLPIKNVILNLIGKYNGKKKEILLLVI